MSKPGAADLVREAALAVHVHMASVSGQRTQVMMTETSARVQGLGEESAVPVRHVLRLERGM